MAKSDIQTNLRLEKPLKDWIRERAKLNKRSMNGEVVVRLEESQRREKQKEATHAN